MDQRIVIQSRGEAALYDFMDQYPGTALCFFGGAILLFVVGMFFERPINRFLSRFN